MDIGLMKKKVYFWMLVAFFLPSVLWFSVWFVVTHINKVQHDQMQTTNSVTTNVVAGRTNTVVTNADGTVTIEHGFRFGFSKPE
jgi:cytochrome oxidase Cu insertion factor (SCO1/SenC/PrrC family)